jgi:hypothetical protein
LTSSAHTLGTSTQAMQPYTELRLSKRLALSSSNTELVLGSWMVASYY